MKCSRLFSALILSALCLGIAPRAVAQVTVILFQPPPNQLRVSDLWRVELFNASDETVEVFLHGIATEARDGRIVDAESRVFKLPPGRLAVRGPQIEPIKVNESNPRYRDVVTRTGTVPTGTYEICVYVRDPATREELGSDCITQIVERFNPPILVAPVDESDVLEKLPVFTWTPPVPLPASGGRVTYTLRIAEIYGRQTAYDALQSNPAFFEQRNVPNTIFQYSVAARSFEKNKRYAWRVTAYDGRVSIGESEVWSFTKKPELTFLAVDENALENTTLAVAAFGFKAADIAGGKGHAAALVGDEDLHLWTWGDNEYGQLGTGGVPTTARAAPKEVSGLNYMTALAPGGEHTLGLGPYGQVAAWGNNDYGQLGLENTSPTNTPKWLSGFTGVTGIAAGNHHSVAVKNDGTVWTWGYNRSGELGSGNRQDRDRPGKVNGIGEITAVAAGNGHTLALKADGTVWAWGTNRYGQADPSPGAAPILDKPHKVGGLANVQAIAAGGNFSLALLKDGTVKAWGANNSGQLGNGEADPDAKLINRFIAGRVSTGSGSSGGKTVGTFRSLETGRGPVGGSTMLAGREVSIVKQIELGFVLTNITGIVSVSGLTNVTAIDAGNAHSLALRSDSTVWAWGNNHWGVLGTADRDYRSGPARVTGANDVTDIAAGAEVSYAIKKSGTVIAWGNNAHKQLGMQEVPASVAVEGETIAISPVQIPKP